MASEARVDTTRQDLAERYAYLGDVELLDLARSGDLTELAQGIALEELVKRGLDPNRDKPESHPSSAENPARAERWRSMLPGLRWIYFAIMVGIWLFGFALFSWQGAYTSQGAPLVNIGSAIVDALCITALYGAIRARPLLLPGIWQIAWVVFTGKGVVGAGYFAYELLWLVELHRLNHTRFPYAFWVDLIGLLGALVSIPLIWVVFNYAFRSPVLWRRQPAAVTTQTGPRQI